jgi:DNA (cytosine-5)-methyltransferase 1
MPRPIAISLFAGAGGLCLGFEQAGFDVPVAIEIDPIHAATHSQNFPMWQTINKPVQLINGDIVRQYTGKSPIDVLIGGSPCQGFSLQGKRDPKDPRSNLIFEFVRLVEQLQPNYFVFENVKGLTQGSCRAVLENAIAQIKKLGYNLPKWQILNAKDYGVPQHRERLFLLGNRRGIAPIAYPQPTGSVTVGEALADIPDVDDDCWYAGNGCVRWFGLITPWSSYATEMQCLSPDSWYRDLDPPWDRSLFTNSQPTQHSLAVRQRFASIAPGTRDPISRFHRLHPDGLSPTLRAGTDRSRGRHTSPRPIHYKYPRCVTVREMARLSGFPDWFQFDHRTWHGARQVGNAVPPPLARAVAGEVMNAIERSGYLEVA